MTIKRRIPVPIKTSTKNVRLTVGPCHVISVHDGDTFTVDIPLDAIFIDLAPHGFLPKVRVAHCNAAEIGTTLGENAASAVAAKLVGKDVTLLIYGREKYGRLLADAMLADGTLLSKYVLSLPGSKPLDLKLQLDERHV